MHVIRRLTPIVAHIYMLVVVLNMPEHSSFQDMLFPMLFISKYAKNYANIIDISLILLHI